MKDLRGKTAFITGGASGMGYAMAQAFAREGMNVMIADIDKDALGKAAATLGAAGLSVKSVETDVTSRGSLRIAAGRTIQVFGKVHLVCNNAGVMTGGAIGETAERDFDWPLDVNLKGVVNGVEIFAPLIMSHGEGGHVVNTASIAGHLASPLLTAYTASKFAVVGMSEAWARELASKNIGVSVLCPGVVATRLAESRAHRPQSYGESAPGSVERAFPQAVAGGIPPEAVAARVVEAVRDNELYIFTHVEYRALIQARFDALLAAFDKSEQSPALAALPPRDPPGWRK